MKYERPLASPTRKGAFPLIPIFRDKGENDQNDRDTFVCTTTSSGTTVANCLSHLPHYTENITTGKGSKSMVNDIPSYNTILAKKRAI